MSRIGKKVIQLPPSVKVDFGEDRAVRVGGPKGELTWQLPVGVSGGISGGEVAFTRSSDERQVRALHGLTRALVNNMVVGVSLGFRKELEIHGVGFKANVQGKILKLNLGFSHDILFPVPDGIKITVADNTKVTIEGIDRQVVGQVAADIRAHYPPEPYKGKGVRYVGEQFARKEGKTVQ